MNGYEKSMSVNEDADDLQIASNTDLENNIETVESCRKRICSPDPTWNKQLKITEMILASKRKRVETKVNYTKRHKYSAESRLVTILPQLLYPQSHFSNINYHSVGS